VRERFQDSPVPCGQACPVFIGGVFFAASRNDAPLLVFRPKEQKALCNVGSSLSGLCGCHHLRRRDPTAWPAAGPSHLFLWVLPTPHVDQVALHPATTAAAAIKVLRGWSAGAAVRAVIAGPVPAQELKTPASPPIARRRRA